MLLYYITDSLQFAGDQAGRCGRLLDNIHEAARCGVDLVQLRELHLSSTELEKLASEAMARIRAARTQTKLLINSRLDIAIASGADGVHLRSGSGSSSEISASEARNIFHKAGLPAATVAVSCHTLQEVSSAEAHGADFAVSGPVYGKVISTPGAGKQEMPGAGVANLRAICDREAAASSRMPVLALGGVNIKNAAECMHNGAAGIAAIRLFQPENLSELEKTVVALRKATPQSTASPRRRHPYQS